MELSRTTSPFSSDGRGKVAAALVSRSAAALMLALAQTICTLSAVGGALRTWGKQVLSATGFKRIGRRSEYAI
jgi:hypothetical protein